MGKSTVLLSLLAVALSATEGETLYTKLGCYGCHGVRGEGVGDYPALAGRPKSYLIKRLKALKRGIGFSSKRDLMIPFAKSLDPKQMEALATYLSSIGQTEDSQEVPADVLGGFGS